MPAIYPPSLWFQKRFANRLAFSRSAFPRLLTFPGLLFTSKIYSGPRGLEDLVRLTDMTAQRISSFDCLPWYVIDQPDMFQPFDLRSRRGWLFWLRLHLQWTETDSLQVLITIPCYLTPSCERSNRLTITQAVLAACLDRYKIMGSGVWI